MENRFDPAMEHPGSTAVPGVAAKPVLDLQVSVDPLDPPERYAAYIEGKDEHMAALEERALAWAGGGSP